MGKKVKEPEVVEKKDPFEGLPRLVCKNKNQELLAKAIKNNDVVVGYGPAGTGKAQPLYSKVYTPDGPINMGDIIIGQEVCTPDGTIAKVTNIYPQGLKDCYRIHFDDETYVDCCIEHLWKVYTDCDREYNRNNNKDRYSIIETKDMIDSVIIRDNRKNYKMPITKPVFYNKQELPLNAYLLGVLIGDGGMTNGNTILSTKDEEIIDLINKIIEEYNLKLKPIKATLEGLDCSYMLSIKDKNITKYNYVTRETDKLGIRCKSENKFIPKTYLYSSIEDRILLLQGLMDTDGTIDKRTGCATFSTSSKKLSNDFCELVRSLGGIATISIKKTNCLDSYIININLPNEIKPFQLTRKLQYIVPKSKYKTPRFISNIEFIGQVEQQCIAIDSSEHLYLTDNHIVTHNTHVALLQAFELAKKNPDKYKSIVLIKSVTVVKSEEIGFIPGSAQEKMDPFMYSFSCLIDKMFDKKGKTKSLLSQNAIEWLPLAFVRGINIDNSIVILDETQNISTDLFKTIITRLGRDSKIIFLGDTEQIDMQNKHQSCLAKICEMFKESEFVKIVKFDESDCVRNKIIPQILQVFKQHEI